MVVKADGTQIGKIRAALYTRVSTERQSQEGYSLEAQHDQLIAYTNDNQMQIFKIYTDPGVSAKNLKRPGVQELIRDLKAGMFDCVIVHKLDRLTRNISDLYGLVELVNEKNVKLISLSEQIDTSNPMGRMFVYLLGIFAQMFRENLGEEVTKGMKTRAKKGLHNITVDLYGYERQKNGDLLIKEEEAKWVRWMFERYAAGDGSPKIAKSLNRQGIRRNKGSKWDHSKVMLSLGNKHYCGQVHNKFKKDDEAIVRQGTHEPIIDPELFNRVQVIMERKREGLISQNSYDYVFGGIVKCAKCGYTYTGMTDKRTPSHARHYACGGKARAGICDQGGISEKKLADLIFKTTFAKGEEYTRKHVPSKQNDEEAEIRKAIRESEARRERWQMAYGDGNMPYEDFSKRMQAEMLMITEIEKKLSTIPKQVVSHLSSEAAVKMINDMKENWDLFEQRTKKDIMQSIFQRIVIRKDGDIWRIDEIVWA
jgi:site-specific DNA recombinase